MSEKENVTRNDGCASSVVEKQTSFGDGVTEVYAGIPVVGMGGSASSVSSEAVRPPLGIKPKRIVEKERFFEILGALERYVRAGMEVPEEWISEMLQLVRKHNDLVSYEKQRGGVSREYGKPDELVDRKQNHPFANPHVGDEFQNLNYVGSFGPGKIINLSQGH